MLKRIVGAILLLSGIVFYGYHLVKKGSEPHFLWSLIGGIVLLIGLWFVLPAPRKKGS